MEPVTSESVLCLAFTPWNLWLQSLYSAWGLPHGTCNCSIARERTHQQTRWFGRRPVGGVASSRRCGTWWYRERGPSRRSWPCLGARQSWCSALCLERLCAPRDTTEINHNHCENQYVMYYVYTVHLLTYTAVIITRCIALFNPFCAKDGSWQHMFMPGNFLLTYFFWSIKICTILRQIQPMIETSDFHIYCIVYIIISQDYCKIPSSNLTMESLWTFIQCWELRTK